MVVRALTFLFLWDKIYQCNLNTGSNNDILYKVFQNKIDIYLSTFIVAIYKGKILCNNLDNFFYAEYLN